MTVLLQVALLNSMDGAPSTLLPILVMHRSLSALNESRESKGMCRFGGNNVLR